MSPMASEAQRGYLWENNPDIAQKLEAKTPLGARLPERVGNKRDAYKRKMDEMDRGQ